MIADEPSIALRRLGLGVRPGELKRIAGDPRGFVAAQLGRPDAARIADQGLEPSHAILVTFQTAQATKKDAKASQVAAAPPPAAAAGPAPAPAMSPATAPAAPAPAAAKPGELRRDAFLDDAFARLQHATTTDAPFLERLVMFWSNHFTVSAAKGGNVRGLAGAFEREAIRPFVLGRFADMLKAVAQHPAMLMYLDNHVSIGPGSAVGRTRSRGLNENLAREILELHTLGVDGGYTQADVTSFARVLTGWTIAGPNQNLPPPFEIGKFYFGAGRHEPGPQTILAKRYDDRGRETGEVVLADLARHPSTARHVGRKLAAHFVSEAASPALAAVLAQTFTRTDGDLAAVARALLGSSEVWRSPPRKIVPPYDLVVSVLRGFSHQAKQGEILRLAASLGQPLWSPPSPKGWPDGDDAWAAPAAIRERLRIAEKAAREVDKLSDPRIVAEELLGGAMSDGTRQAIARAETREQGLELLMMSPEFQRR